MTSWNEAHRYMNERDDEPPYCPTCGRFTTSGVLCEECRDEDPSIDPPEYCHCGLAEEEHVYPTVDHSFTPKSEAVFTHCNVCGRKLHTPDEDKVGMCEGCGNL